VNNGNRKDLDGSSRGLFEVLSRHLPGLFLFFSLFPLFLFHFINFVFPFLSRFLQCSGEFLE
jgi:hypothetical protein